MQKNSQFVAVFFINFLWIGLSVAEELVPSLFVFGDSLVDVGNNNYLPHSIAKANYPHNGVDFPTGEPTGRFSNGKNLADLLAERLGLPSPPPYLSLKNKGENTTILTGVNFASGGSGIFNSTTNSILRCGACGSVTRPLDLQFDAPPTELSQSQTTPLSAQVNDYLSVHQELVNEIQSSVQTHLSKSIFMIVIGSNDLFDQFGSFDLWRNTDPQGCMTFLVTELEKQLKRLHDSGARKFLMVGVGQIGCIPGERVRDWNQQCDEEANKRSSMYNDALQTMLQKLQQELQGSFRYSYFGSYEAMEDVFAEPAAYGLTDVKSACCGDGELNALMSCHPKSQYCPDRTRHFFWDRYGHPTEATARVIVDHMFNASSPYSFPINAQQLVSMEVETI